MKHAVLVSSLFLATLVAIPAMADETAAKPTITLKLTTVYGHPQRPAAAIEVSRVRMTLPATTPTLSGASKIQDASKKDPF